MKIEYKDIQIREATMEDAEQLYTWWNDGVVMEHAGFPNGLGITLEEIRKDIEGYNGKVHMIVFKNERIGEMNYRDVDFGICEIGIKICDFSKHNQGLGKLVLSLFINVLFNEYKYQKIVLNTNLNNVQSQHVYERLGFKKICINSNSWKDQLGVWQSSVNYELTSEAFVPFL